MVGSCDYVNSLMHVATHNKLMLSQVSGWFLSMQLRENMREICSCARSGSEGETESGCQGCALSSTAQLLIACQVKADGDYRCVIQYKW